MAKQAKQLTETEVLQGWSILPFEQQVNVFKVIKERLEAKKKENAQQLNDLQAVGISNNSQ